LEISGPEKSGKTTIVQLVVEALAKAGIAYEVIDGDDKE